MKKIIVLISTMLLFASNSYSQESFKKSLETISSDLCSKMVQKNKKKIVVLFVTDINKAQTTIGKYMADVASYYIVNNPNGFSVFDRENLSGFAEAKKLISEGYIDANNAKQLGKILSVEAIVVGNYTVLSSTLSLTLKALDVNDGFLIGQSLNDLPIDRDAAALLGIAPLDGSQNSLSNKGYDNRPLNSNESYNNQETVNKNCITNNSGDYCFQNLTSKKISVRLFKGGNSMDCDLEPKQTQCFYNLEAGDRRYVMTGFNPQWAAPDNSREGYLLIEKCKSKTFVIK